MISLIRISDITTSIIYITSAISYITNLIFLYNYFDFLISLNRISDISNSVSDTLLSSMTSPGHKVGHIFEVIYLRQYLS